MNKAILITSILAVSTVFFPFTVNASKIIQPELADFNPLFISNLNKKDSISVIKNPINKSSQLTLINSMPFKKDNLVEIEFAKENIIWVGELLFYPYLGPHLKKYNSTFIFWHQVSHTMNKPSTLKNSYASHGVRQIDANALLHELTAEIFALIALMKQHDLSFIEVQNIAINLNSNKLSTPINSEGYHPINLLTAPGIVAALKFIEHDVNSIAKLSYEEVYNLSSNIALHSIETDLNLYVDQIFNSINPEIMRDYIYKISLSQRCYICTKYDFKSFEDSLSPMYLYPAAHKAMAKIFELKSQLNKLPERDFSIAIYDLLKNLEDTPGMSDFSGSYYLFDHTVVHNFYEHASDNSKAYQILLTLVKNNVLSNANSSWIETPYSKMNNIK